MYVLYGSTPYSTEVTEAEYRSESKPTKHIPYLAFPGELWSFVVSSLDKIDYYNHTTL